jgi:hypothetical protein
MRGSVVLGTIRTISRADRHGRPGYCTEPANIQWVPSHPTTGIDRGKVPLLNGYK